MKTPLQKSPSPFLCTIDRATAMRLALESKSDPAAYAAGLLMLISKTAIAVGQRPHDVIALGVVQAVSTHQVNA